MEKRGIRFKIPNSDGEVVYKSLKPIKLENYQWFIDWVEVYGKDINWEFTQPHIEGGSKLKERIMQGEYTLIFGKFIAFPQNEKVHDFEKHEDFLKSKSELVLLIVDVYYYDIYWRPINDKISEDNR